MAPTAANGPRIASPAKWRPAKPRWKNISSLACPLTAELERGELRFLIDGIPVVTGIFPPPEQAPFILAQWKVLASRTEVKARTTGKKLAAELRKVALNAENHIMADVIRLQEEIATAETEISTLEHRINQTIYRLHDLTAEEISIVESAVS